MSRPACAVLVVLASVVFLPAREAPPSLADWAKKVQGRRAYGLYMGGKKAGWVIEDFKLARHAGTPVLEVYSEMYMATLFEGQKSVKEEKTRFCYELAGAGNIVFASQYRQEDGKELSRRAVRRGKGLRITTKQRKETLARDVAMPKDNLANMHGLDAWLRGPRKAGDRFTRYSMSWDDADVDQKEVVTFKRKKTIKLDRAEVPLAVVEIDDQGGKLDSELFLDGRRYQDVLGKLMTVKLEKEGEAKKVSGAPVDLLRVAAIAIDRDLGQARRVQSLKLELTEVGDFKMPESHRQVVKQRKGRTILELKRDFRLEKGGPLSKEEVKRYTRTTPRLQCDSKRVADLVRKIVGEETKPLKKARLIERWVYRELKQTYQDSADTALSVLDRMAGACTEHSLLFVALARAAGVPAREVGGLAFVRGETDDRPMFGWHAWAEVHDGHQWVSIDPTWNQVYVDATHIKLSEGPRDMAWTNVAGRLKIKVLAVKKGR
jgi:hypothetical protein